jgi:hypothetical protein
MNLKAEEIKNISIDQEIGGIIKSNSKDVALMDII